MDRIKFNSGKKRERGMEMWNEGGVEEKMKPDTRTKDERKAGRGGLIEE